ncbi:MAG: hypothetical protein II727_02840 [Oscillospiraceae bacterium]|nr:hypothetical protein [Oscillospiraceae bacterium]
MSKKKWITGLSSVLLVLLLLASYVAIAADTTGQEDPLVSLSYLTDVLAPETIEKVNAAIDLKADELEKSINLVLSEYTAQLEDTIGELESRYNNLATDSSFINAVSASVIDQMGTSGTATGGSAWSLVSVSAGETYKFEVGGMCLLRIGSANCYTPSSPGLIDTTTGGVLDGGQGLEKNHLYLITVAERGFTAKTDCKIMVFGSYTKG